MDDAAVTAVVSEIAPLLIGRAPGKIFQLGQQSLAIDFGLREHGYLFVSVEPVSPRLYLIKRSVRDLEKQSVPLNQFALGLRKELARTRLRAVEKTPADRVVSFTFEGVTELGGQKERTIVAQLTGRSANLLLLDHEQVVVAQMRTGPGDGQSIGSKYKVPAQQGVSPRTRKRPRTLHVIAGTTVSEFLDEQYTSLAARTAAASELAAARAQLAKEILRKNKLLKKLENDLNQHADAEQHKRIGDLLLANVGSAKRVGSRLKLIDYFDDASPEVEIEMDEKTTVPEEASRRFERYSRSKRARVQIAKRIQQVQAELSDLQVKREQLETSPELVSNSKPASPRESKARSRSAARIPGARRYVSSDGYEILVGRASRDNDNLTFKVAKPNDLWLHAADYPGSHVIVRNPTRKEIPQRTLIEAAQLAAHFSQAGKDPKVDVHFTQRKFLAKPKGAAPGLVRLSRFKSLTVAPAEAGQRVL